MDASIMIADLQEVLRQQILRARSLASLPAEALLYRTAPDQWNALEIMEHMVLSSGIYLRGLERVFDERAATLPFRREFKPGLLGDYFTKGMQPRPDGQLRNRMRTLRMFDPARNEGASPGSIDRFVDQGERFLALLDRARTTDLNRMKVVSSLGPIIRFKAGDAFRFPIAHQQRHFLQLERVLAAITDRR